MFPTHFGINSQSLTDDHQKITSFTAVLVAFRSSIMHEKEYSSTLDTIMIYRVDESSGSLKFLLGCK